MPVSLPLSSGITLPTALAAPVAEGMMLPRMPRPPRQSFLEGASTVFWVAVVAWTVVMRPSTILKLSCMTLVRGARQEVVQVFQQLTESRTQYVKEVAEIREGGGTVGEEEE